MWGKWAHFRNAAAAATIAALCVLAGPLTGDALAAPALATAPTLSPSPVQAGQTVTLTPGTYTPATASVTNELWQVCDGSTCASVSPDTAGGDTYTTVASDAGKTVQVTETATDSADTSSVTEIATASVTAPPAPQLSGAGPLLSPSGPASVGATITLTQGAWANATSITDQWQRCNAASQTSCTNVAQNVTSYQAASADVGHMIAVTETASDSGTNAAPVTTNYVSVAAANTALPTISDAQQVGQTLSVTFNGSWNFTPSAYAYQWYRCTTSTSCTAISNAIGSSYVTATADVGDTLYVQVTANGTVDTLPVSATANTAQTPNVIVPPAPGNRAAPTISGTPQSGQTLTEGAATWATNSSYTLRTSIQWWSCDSNKANCVSLPGATGSTLSLGSGDIGSTIQVCESAVYVSGTTDSSASTSCSGFSSAVTDITGVVPVPKLSSGAPTLSGTPQLGGSLTATRAAFSNNPGTYSFQWRRCKSANCSDIPGATALTYTLTPADVGYGLQIVESATNTGGMSSQAQSPISPVITAPSATSLQSSDATPSAGQSVSLIAAVSTPAAASAEAGTITFTSDGRPIRGCSHLPLAPDPTQPVICRTAFDTAHHSLAASFAPAAGTYVTGSASPAVALSVHRASTTIALSGTSRVLLGRTSTYRATLRPRSAGLLVPGGRIAFLDAGRKIVRCGSRALHHGVATCQVRYATLRTHAITARYRGAANFAPSRSPTQRVTVTPQTPTGVVASYISWTFAYGLHKTGVRALSVSGLRKGTIISMTCSGAGCAFHRYRRTIAAPKHCAAGHACRAPSSVDLTPVFAHQRLHVGAKLIVRLSHPGWVGKYYRFTVRRGRGPILHEACLAVGDTRPSVGCTAGT